MSFVSLPQTVRSLARLRVIAQTLTKHGFGAVVERVQLRRYIPLPKWLAGPPPAHEPDAIRSIGQRLVRVCEELGPTWIKLGQLAAGRPDVLPAAIIDELSRLQDRVAPFPPEQARQIVADAIRQPIEQAFRQFEPQPLASGSMAQVHRATTKAGMDVVVKVRRPGIESVISTDVTILRWLAAGVERHVPELRFTHPAMLVDEFAHAIQRELDFINEASVTERFGQAFAGDAGVKVPGVVWELTESNVLTLEYVDGLKAREVLEDTSGRCDRRAMARNLATAFMRQFFELGLFHADAHAGNMFFQPPAKVALIDFGNAGQLDDEVRARLVFALVGTTSREVDLVVDALADVGAIGDGTDRAALRRDMREMLDKYYGLPLRRLEMAAIFRETMDLARRHDLRLPREFVQLGRSLVAAAGVALQLDPELNLLAIIEPRLRQTIRNYLSGRRVVRELGLSAWHLVNILRDAPRVMRDVLRKSSRGQLQMNVRHENIDHLATEVDHASNRLAFSVLMAATFIGSSLVITQPAHEAMFGVPVRYFGLAGYVASFFMAAWLVIAILRSGKLS
ncbi:MAG: AarF/ABC1/UbiB kinase family protein [Phycisphaerae bacterium]